MNNDRMRLPVSVQALVGLLVNLQGPVGVAEPDGVVAAGLEVPVLAKLPIDPALAAAFDAGKIEDFPTNYMAELAGRLEG